MRAHAVVVDASVFVADASGEEPYHQDASALLHELALQGVRLYLPAIAMPEVAAALSRGTGNPDTAREAVALYLQWPGVSVVAVSEELGERAVDIAASRGIRGCDAVYVALASALGAMLVTNDHQQRERAPEGVIARTPRAALGVMRATR